MMKRIFFIIFISLFILFDLVAQVSKPKSYALVIGVSNYEDPKINSLNHAHTDAAAFADFSLSPGGLNIPSDQIRILTNEKATYWNIVDGLDWLKSQAQKNDQIYIYFAGHGDMESKELKYGYLLAHDSRHMNYLGRSLSLDLLNKTANTLTVNKKAKVFLITDACHSGKLAGVDFNGSNLVALNLMQLINSNEVRITSCNEGELSYEDQAWGNGRGAFSYYLNKGMSGEADGVNGKKDGSITVAEIKAYLNGKVPDDVRMVKKAKQTPVVMGTETSIINQYTLGSTSLNNTITQPNAIESATGSRSVSGNAINVLEEDITSAIDSIVRDKNIDFKLLVSKPTSEIVSVLLKELIKTKKYSKKTLSSNNAQILVAKALYNKVQHILDLYLSGDVAELEKRRYYNQVTKPYDQYPYMLEIAIQLLPKNHEIIPTLQMQKEYLTGLSYRIKIPFAKDYMEMIDSAIICQQKAMALDSGAAYIHNEFGILNLYKRNDPTAKYHFEKAITISPLWSLPYANLASYYLTTKNDTLAKKYVDKALDRQDNRQNPYLVAGSINMNADNLLFAEEQFQKAIKINSRHFLPFEKLGQLYLQAQDYDKSNEYYYQAELRKLGLSFLPPNIILVHVEDHSSGLPSCKIDSTKADPNDVMATFAVGKHYFDLDSFHIAQRWLEKIVNLDVVNPLVYHYLGQTAYFFKSYDKAEFYFNKAIELHLPDSLFSKHVNVMNRLSTAKNLDAECFFKTYREAQFDSYTTNLFLARTYEKWGNFAAAEKQYNECINIKADIQWAYHLLVNLYKKRSQIESAENTIHRLGFHYPNLLDKMLADFYGWVLNKYKEDLKKTELYAYKYGLLMFSHIKKNPEIDWKESLEPMPDQEDMDFTDSFESKFSSLVQNEYDKVADDINYVSSLSIDKPISTGVIMFKKVVSISVDNDVKAEAYAKMGEIYLLAKSNIKALASYENSLSLKEDDIGIRSISASIADELYFFKKALNHLEILNETNGLNFDDAEMLAEYYMKSGKQAASASLYDNIGSVHPELKDDIEEDVIKLYLRFGNYQKTIDLINQWIESGSTDNIFEYMLARAYAGLNNPEESLTHLQKAEKLGFDLGFVYKNDAIFNPYRSINDKWKEIQSRMEEFISLKMKSQISSN